MEMTEICTCVTGLAGRKDALEVQKTSGTALCSAITFQVALGKSLTLSYTAHSLTGNHGETKRCSYSAVIGLRQAPQRGYRHALWPGHY